MAYSYAERLMRVGTPAEVAKLLQEMLGDIPAPTASVRGGVLQQAAIASLTGTVGTANDAMTALAALAASTLATDFATQKTSLDAVITAQNAVTTANNNNLADLQAKVNAILVAVRAAGIVVP